MARIAPRPETELLERTPEKTAARHRPEPHDAQKTEVRESRRQQQRQEDEEIDPYPWLHQPAGNIPRRQGAHYEVKAKQRRDGVIQPQERGLILKDRSRDKKRYYREVHRDHTVLKPHRFRG